MLEVNCDALLGQGPYLLRYQIDQIQFDYNPKEIINSYISKIKTYGFEKNHPFIKFTSLSESDGLYDTDPYPIISLTNCKIDNPLKTLYHELGHHLYFGFDDTIQIKIKKYINDNKRIIKNPIKFLNKCKRLNLRQLQKSNPKLYNCICSILGYLYEEENSLYYLIPKLTCTMQIRVSNPISINTKLESLYCPDEEEIFCEMFAAYMIGNCLYKSNRKFIEDIISQSS